MKRGSARDLRSLAASYPKESLGINTKFETKIYSITNLSPKKQHVTKTDDNRFQHQRYLIRAIYGTQNVVEFPKMWLSITGQVSM